MKSVRVEDEFQFVFLALESFDVVLQLGLLRLQLFRFLGGHTDTMF